MYVAMGSKAGMCILGCKVVSCVQCGEMCERGRKEWHFVGVCAVQRLRGSRRSGSVCVV